MKYHVRLALIFCVLGINYSVSISMVSNFNVKNEEDMRLILETYNQEGSLLKNRLVKANWDVQTHIDTVDEYSRVLVRKTSLIL